MRKETKKKSGVKRRNNLLGSFKELFTKGHDHGAKSVIDLIL